ncbi:MAG: hypothetical protein Q8Q35_01440 [Nanoarchaeota archaeon]|nr:hypothetical protein [Nanoarchaeota archaeon]
MNRKKGLIIGIIVVVILLIILGLTLFRGNEIPGDEVEDNEVVIDLGESLECEIDSDCDSGEECIDNICIDKKGAEPQCGDGNCDIGENCPADCGCEIDSDCDSGEECVSGTCAVETTTSSSGGGGGGGGGGGSSDTTPDTTTPPTDDTTSDTISVPCTSDDDCGGNGYNVCDLENEVCVGCFEDNNCDFGNYCIVGSNECVKTECYDEIDNDEDGGIDYLSDPGCINVDDMSEKFSCWDNIDNDDDGEGIDATGGCDTNLDYVLDYICYCESGGDPDVIDDDNDLFGPESDCTDGVYTCGFLEPTITNVRDILPVFTRNGLTCIGVNDVYIEADDDCSSGESEGEGLSDFTLTSLSLNTTPSLNSIILQTSLVNNGLGEDVNFNIVMTLTDENGYTFTCENTNSVDAYGEVSTICEVDMSESTVVADYYVLVDVEVIVDTENLVEEINETNNIYQEQMLIVWNKCIVDSNCEELFGVDSTCEYVDGYTEDDGYDGYCDTSNIIIVEGDGITNECEDGDELNFCGNYECDISLTPYECFTSCSTSDDCDTDYACNSWYSCEEDLNGEGVVDSEETGGEVLLGIGFVCTISDECESGACVDIYDDGIFTCVECDSDESCTNPDAAYCGIDYTCVECVEDIDCGEGFCFRDECNYEICNNYVDDDRDNLVDLTGGCDTIDDSIDEIDSICGCYFLPDETFTSYSDCETDSDTCTRYCEAGSIYGCVNLIDSEFNDLTCSELIGSYYGPDTSCVEGPSFAAPEGEAGFWAMVWDFLIFWN